MLFQFKICSSKNIQTRYFIEIIHKNSLSGIKKTRFYLELDTFQCLHKPLAGCLISYLLSVSTTITHQFHCCSVACIRSNTQRTTDKHHQLSPLFISDNFVSKLHSGIEWRWPPPTTDPPHQAFLSLSISLRTAAPTRHPLSRVCLLVSFRTFDLSIPLEQQQVRN